jgi:hypothetical protein
MNKMMKKVLVGVMAATMLLGTVTTAFAATDSPATAPEPVKQTAVEADNGAQVNTTKKGTAVITSIAATTKKSVSVPSKVTVDGVEYKVTTIGAKTFADATNATKVSLPSTITTIGAKAFTGATKVKTIAITSKQTVTVNKNAFKNVNTKKMTITVKTGKKGMTTKQYNKLVKSLKAAGFKGKVKKVK